MKHRIVLEGEQRELEIRAMTEDFIVWRKMFTAPLTADNMGKADPEYLAAGLADGRFKVVEEFFRKQIRAMGSCMILAWDGTGVVGKMHFTTREMHEALGGPERWDSHSCYCVDHAGFAPALLALTDEEQYRLLKSPTRTLRVLCFNIGHTDPRWHGQGTAKAMIEYLKQWARERGWRRIEARACPDIAPTTVVGDWMLRRAALERRGFHVVEETQAPPERASRLLSEIERFLSGGKDNGQLHEYYARNVRRLAVNSNWKSEYDKEYLMACDL